MRDPLKKREYSKTWRLLNADRVREYERARQNNPARQAAKRNREPLKIQARMMANNAIKRGIIVRPSSCSSCGIHCFPHAHHDDYSKPLAVRFLCKQCHYEFHNPQALFYLDDKFSMWTM